MLNLLCRCCIDSTYVFWYNIHVNFRQRKGIAVGRMNGVCEQCGTHFSYFPSEQTGRYCSHPCSVVARDRPLADRISERIQKTDTCWLWTGSCNPHGYGQISVNGRPRLVTRMTWTIHHGSIPPGMNVCHTCDIPACVRPDHLFLGTHSSNMRDMVSKNRHAARTHPERIARGERNGAHTRPDRLCRGESSPAAKLSESDVARIRHLFATESRTRTSLGEEFGVSRQQITRILLGQSWRHLQD
jgi:hypothetical protein